MKSIFNIFSKKKNYLKENMVIQVDYREKNSLVPSILSKKFEIDWKQLAVGDYVVKGIAIERKTVSDLKSSIIDKRIISQLLELKQYPKHLILVEGILDEDLYNSGIHENALRGFLLSVALEYQTPIIFTYDEKDTAKYIEVLARKEPRSDFSLRASKIFLSREEQLQFILEGFPNIGGVKAKKLLERFHTLNNIFQASEEELAEILGKRAKEFKDLLD